MSHIAENDRAADRCNECGSIYTANIRPNGDIVPIGIPHCRDCGSSEFTIFSEPDEDPSPVDE